MSITCIWEADQISGIFNGSKAVLENRAKEFCRENGISWFKVEFGNGWRETACESRIKEYLETGHKVNGVTSKVLVPDYISLGDLVRYHSQAFNKFLSRNPRTRAYHITTVWEDVFDG